MIEWHAKRCDDLNLNFPPVFEPWPIRADIIIIDDPRPPTTQCEQTNYRSEFLFRVDGAYCDVRCVAGVANSQGTGIIAGSGDAVASGNVTIVPYGKTCVASLPASLRLFSISGE